MNKLEYNRLWRLRNPEKVREYRRRNKAKRQKTRCEIVISENKEFRVSEKQRVINRKQVAEWYRKNKKYRKVYSRLYHQYRATKSRSKGRANECAMCGMDIPCVLDVHHPVPSAPAVITLCANCHRVWHFIENSTSISSRYEEGKL